MFVPGLTAEELIKEFEADFSNVMRVCDAKQVHVDKQVRKSRMFPMYFYTIITSTRKNRWIIWWEAQNRKNIGDLSIITFAAILNFQSGRYAFMRSFANKQPIYILYIPHFLCRYSLRAGIDLTGEELIKRFFKLNASYGFTIKKDIWFNVAKINVYGSTDEGIAMGVKLNSEKDIILFKTFITYDMMKGQQIEDFTLADETRREINEKDLTIE